MKYRDPDPLQPIAGHENRQAEQSARSLNCQCAPKYLAKEPDQSVHCVQIEGTFQQNPVLQRDLSSDQHQNARCEGDDAQTAQLDEHQNDDMAEQAPMGKSVHHSQAGHT